MTMGRLKDLTNKVFYYKKTYTPIKPLDGQKGGQEWTSDKIDKIDAIDKIDFKENMRQLQKYDQLYP